MAKMSSTGLVDITIGGSYLCHDYELRVTERCLADDLGCSSEHPFEELAGHEIITAFVNRRRSSPTNTRQVAPLSSGKVVYRLAYGDRHRGATWHDEANGVVWLLAYARHEFRDQGDAFPYFKRLDADGDLTPTERDYEALFRDRDRRFAEVVARQAEELLAAAREQPGREQRAIVGGQLGVGVALEIVETLEEVYLAVKTARLTQENLAILVAAVFQDQEFHDLEWVDALPHRALDGDELACRCLLE